MKRSRPLALPGDSRRPSTRLTRTPYAHEEQSAWGALPPEMRAAVAHWLPPDAEHALALVSRRERAESEARRGGRPHDKVAVFRAIVDGRRFAFGAWYYTTVRVRVHGRAMKRAVGQALQAAAVLGDEAVIDFVRSHVSTAGANSCLVVSQLIFHGHRAAWKRAVSLGGRLLASNYLYAAQRNDKVLLDALVACRVSMPPSSLLGALICAGTHFYRAMLPLVIPPVICWLGRGDMNPSIQRIYYILARRDEGALFTATLLQGLPLPDPSVFEDEREIHFNYDEVMARYKVMAAEATAAALAAPQDAPHERLE